MASSKRPFKDITSYFTAGPSTKKSNITASVDETVDDAIPSTSLVEGGDTAAAVIRNSKANSSSTTVKSHQKHLFRHGLNDILRLQHSRPWLGYEVDEEGTADEKISYKLFCIPYRTIYGNKSKSRLCEGLRDGVNWAESLRGHIRRNGTAHDDAFSLYTKQKENCIEGAMGLAKSRANITRKPDLATVLNLSDIYFCGKNSLPMNKLYALHDHFDFKMDLILKNAQERLDFELERENVPIKFNIRTNIPSQTGSGWANRSKQRSALLQMSDVVLKERVKEF